LGGAISLEGDNMDIKTIELLEDLAVILSFDYLAKYEKEEYRKKIKDLLNELA